LPYRVAQVPAGEPVERIWSATHTPILGPNGEVEFILQHTVDVTQLHELQRNAQSAGLTLQTQAGLLDRAQRLAESNRALGSQIKLLQGLFDQAPGFVTYLRGPELIFEISNRAYYELVGRSDLLGKPIREALPDLAGQGYFELLERVLRTRQPFVGRGMAAQLTRPPRNEPDEVLVDFVFQPIVGPDGQAHGILVQGNDVTEQKRQEVRQRFLAGAGEALAAAVSDLEQALCALARSAVPSFADWVTLDLLEDARYRRALVVHADAKQTRLAEAVYAYAPDANALPEHIARARAQGCPVVVEELGHAETTAITRDGSHGDLVRTIGLRSVMTVPLSAGDAHLGMLTFALSRSSRHYAAADAAMCEELMRMVAIAADNARLSRERRQLLEAAEAARARAEAANQAKDEFLAMLGHELRNPLAPILTAVQLMKLRGDQASERERVIIERQAQHMVRLVDDLLDVSRIARGKVELRSAPLDLAIAIHKAVETTSPLFEHKSHQLRLSLPDAQLPVFGDEARLSQVVVNLLSNAARYTPAHGHIELTARQVGDGIELAVRDDGIGIPPEILPRVFELFVQAPQRSDRREGGLGLGLTLVRNLVAMHGGQVSAHSLGHGQGSEFVVRLPALARAAFEQPLAAEVPAVPAVAGQPRVLIVDDNTDAAELLSQLLARRGYRTALAFDGPSAIEAAQRFEPELAILDIGLPVMDGYELAARLRSLLGARAPRMIALTGYGQEHDRARSQAGGFHAHIVKPVDAEELLRALA
jgi:signal transduction histidine kinase/PAS domain-containing protein